MEDPTASVLMESNMDIEISGYPTKTAESTNLSNLSYSRMPTRSSLSSKAGSAEKSALQDLSYDSHHTNNQQNSNTKNTATRRRSSQTDPASSKIMTPMTQFREDEEDGSSSHQMVSASEISSKKITCSCLF
jgi:hypothetical protein